MEEEEEEEGCDPWTSSEVCSHEPEHVWLVKWRIILPERGGVSGSEERSGLRSFTRVRRGARLVALSSVSLSVLCALEKVGDPIEQAKIITMTTMAVPVTLPVHSGTSSVSAKLFCSEPFFSSAVESPQVINSLSATLPCSAATNECKIVEVHGVKVASFSVDGQELICLPQVFDLFLKHLVGGLHTVYTKLKRLDINPVVCTVEQVRVLRGLGAIQPGVNRCKLISRNDFEALYSDCTNAR
ncbi:hypothetical protein DNTS_012114 [Danionella cerebrum]|uniref:SKI/SNO/DAC domain-containing protein n=1 Tax=Danionella cerebrum TaxID=2873325 RepID=A0A553PUD2_9TELE|nr:hypothetical protein DNTS_012114 [Danionella translucida]